MVPSLAISSSPHLPPLRVKAPFQILHPNPTHHALLSSLLPFPFLQLPTRTRTTILLSVHNIGMRRVLCALLPTLDPLVPFPPAYLVEEHSCRRQRINNAANPLSCSGRYRCAHCGERNAEAPLYPFNSSSTSLLFSSYYQPSFTDL